MFQNLRTSDEHTLNRFFLLCCPPGQFPRHLRYFSISTYDTRGLTVQSITDFQVRSLDGTFMANNRPMNGWMSV